jgi:hypothetical protein
LTEGGFPSQKGETDLYEVILFENLNRMTARKEKNENLIDTPPDSVTGRYRKNDVNNL